MSTANTFPLRVNPALRQLDPGGFNYGTRETRGSYTVSLDELQIAVMEKLCCTQQPTFFEQLPLEARLELSRAAGFRKRCGWRNTIPKVSM